MKSSALFVLFQSKSQHSRQRLLIIIFLVCSNYKQVRTKRDKDMDEGKRNKKLSKPTQKKSQQQKSYGNKSERRNLQCDIRCMITESWPQDQRTRQCHTWTYEGRKVNLVTGSMFRSGRCALHHKNSQKATSQPQLGGGEEINLGIFCHVLRYSWRQRDGTGSLFEFKTKLIFVQYLSLHIGKILQYILLLYAQYIACVSEYNISPYMKC